MSSSLAATPGENAHCHLCNEDFPQGTDLAQIVDHLRVIHPDQYGDGPALWPDGGPVIHDETLEPGDFQ